MKPVFCKTYPSYLAYQKPAAKPKQFMPDSFLESDSLLRPRVNPITYAIAAAVILAAVIWLRTK